MNRCPNADVLGRSCKRTSCPVCGPRWAAAWEQNFASNFAAAPGDVVLVSITAPGVDVLPWDEAHCSHRRKHQHRGPSGCRVEQQAAYEWTGTATWRLDRLRRGAAAHVRRRLCQCGHTRRAHAAGACSCGCEKFKGYQPRMLGREWEPQKRGVPHWHGVFDYSSERARRAVRLYVGYMRTRRRLEHGGRDEQSIAESWGFGFVDGHLKPQTAEVAARYLSTYLTGRNPHKPTVRQNAVDPVMTILANADDLLGPPEVLKIRRVRMPLCWLDHRLSKVTGVCMRTLRYVRWYFAAVRGNAGAYPCLHGEKMIDVARAIANVRSGRSGRPPTAAERREAFQVAQKNLRLMRQFG